jgi:hypothetical protein
MSEDFNRLVSENLLCVPSIGRIVGDYNEKLQLAMAEGSRGDLHQIG